MLRVLGHAGISDVNVVTDEVRRSLWGGGHFGGDTPTGSRAKESPAGLTGNGYVGELFLRTFSQIHRDRR